MGEGKIPFHPLILTPHHPLQVAQVDPKVMRLRELTLPLTNCSTQEISHVPHPESTVELTLLVGVEAIWPVNMHVKSGPTPHLSYG